MIIWSECRSSRVKQTAPAWVPSQIAALSIESSMRTSTGANTSNPAWNHSLALGQNFQSGMFRKSERDGYSNTEAMIKQLSIY